MVIVVVIVVVQHFHKIQRLEKRVHLDLSACNIRMEVRFYRVNFFKRRLSFYVGIIKN